MKKLKCASPKIRTVTEIINGKDKLKRDYDLTEFDAKSLNSRESYNIRKINLILVKYIAMLKTLELSEPLLTIFRDRNMEKEIITIVFASLGFVHNRFDPLINHFNSRMEFVVLEDRDLTIPGEPIVFHQNENDCMVCNIDRVAILKSIERYFDTNMCMDDIMKEKNKIKMIKAFSSSGSKKRRISDGDRFETDENFLTEAQAFGI
ncbi:occlusion derived viral protein-e27 [Apocheima cinerarium nucleopolyhedrovirus]|uniref:occlusion derived viral protein-e27 n=1 Tax=Apocheima cinerarium nucleopolyhedrovirus TaxID=307461 RepID=UPI0001D920D3|nr:occlusion derived viral protein-e27 [Apocheima cinerarium nucleopolyhedrovirus]ADB84472.1 occlusion derived viral protein-e27 [Apocheima cinerarium nucleopolyhedrovirus]